MALQRFGFIVSGAGLDPARHHATLASPQFTMFTVGVAHPGQGAEVARRLIEAHDVQLIELCGGFAAPDVAAVQQAVAGRVPVGSVAYGPEAIDGLHRLFAD